MVKVSVKWGKELFTDVEVDLSQPPLAFKTQLFSLSNVPPERQKVLIKGGQLKDDDWGKQVPKDGLTIMMMGTADEIKVDAPENAPTFVEDLPEEEQDTLGTKAYGSGLVNLGNTCYMNSTLQCLYSAEGLREAIQRYLPPGSSPATKLASATKELFSDLQKGGQPFPPFKFLLSLRERFPQFAQQNNQGVYMQQDAEECWSQLFYTLREQLKGHNGDSVVDKLFGVQLQTNFKCEESGEEQQETTIAYMLKANIAGDTNYLSQAIQLGLVDDREKNSAKLGRLALFKGTAALASLPPHLAVQLMRFFYKADVQQKAKILRKVTFPLELDVLEFCTPELKKQLEGPREAYKAWDDAQIEAKKTAPKQQKLDDGAAKPGLAATTPEAAAAGGGDTDMKEAGDAAAGPSTASSPYVGALTGKYHLTGVLTHKGRSADSGHYVAWIKQKDGSWVLFDDDQLIPKKAEDVLALAGGGDWHMAYMLMYTAQTVPADGATS